MNEIWDVDQIDLKKNNLGLIRSQLVIFFNLLSQSLLVADHVNFFLYLAQVIKRI